MLYKKEKKKNSIVYNNVPFKAYKTTCLVSFIIHTYNNNIPITKVVNGSYLPNRLITYSRKNVKPYVVKKIIGSSLIK